MKSALKTFKALADPTRLRIAAILLRSEVCVCELTAILGMEQSRISHQLRILRDADIVEDRRERRWIVYAIPEGSRPALELLLENFLKEKSAESDEITQDLARVKSCLKQSVRAEHASSSPSPRRTP
ncbi:MAG TPA: metalloregulator ArsR/SmtB family transcription factor [Candidatus Desulfaltia sp.]|nr:metalloregulator ArsR/SmtB family transcription factor [Candidatus Desulfaltia sp.]